MLLDLWGLLQRNLFRGANAGGGKRVIIEYLGKQYIVPLDDVGEFLAARKEDVSLPRHIKRRIRRSEPVEIKRDPPRMVVQEAPPEYRPMIQAKVDQTNEIVARIWKDLIVRELRERDEEEALILLLGE